MKDNRLESRGHVRHSGWEGSLIGPNALIGRRKEDLGLSLLSPGCFRGDAALQPPGSMVNFAQS